ncbi:MAG: BrnT family toxin [archaeon]|nr:BrnT family toxin [archaeon]
MPIKDVILTKKVEHHIGKHEVTREEIMDVLNGFKYVKRKGKRFLFYGKTKAGRYLTVVLEKNREYFLVTARESTKSEKVLYKKKVK